MCIYLRFQDRVVASWAWSSRSLVESVYYIIIERKPNTPIELFKSFKLHSIAAPLALSGRRTDHERGVESKVKTRMLARQGCAFPDVVVDVWPWPKTGGQQRHCFGNNLRALFLCPTWHSNCPSFHPSIFPSFKAESNFHRQIQWAQSLIFQVSSWCSCSPFAHAVTFENCDRPSLIAARYVNRVEVRKEGNIFLLWN